MRYRSTALFLIGIVLLGVFASHFNSSSAQEPATATPEPTETPTPPPTPTAYSLQGLKFGLLALAEVEATTDGPTSVSAATLTVGPGQASLPFVNEVETIIAVTAGAVVVESDQALVQVVDSAVLVGLEVVSGTPGPVDRQSVTVGWQVRLPAGSTTTIRNDTAAPATLMVLTLRPNEPSAVATPVS